MEMSERELLIEIVSELRDLRILREELEPLLAVVRAGNGHGVRARAANTIMNRYFQGPHQ